MTTGRVINSSVFQPERRWGVLVRKPTSSAARTRSLHTQMEAGAGAAEAPHSLNAYTV
ncbi:hypothetical protein PC128_g9384 [Phytophthora cactorum]|nr:hypothetical protein PC128_g9384 [Phytophthora cactorum]